MVKVALGSALAVARISMAVFALGGLVYIAILEPVAVLINTIAVFVAVGVLILIGVVVGWFDNRRRIKLQKILVNGETETSLARAKYMSWKNGICIPVEFKE
jgi:ABC-type proline/glycine betaine transport system permease subunit